MKCMIATKNEGKIESARRAFLKFYSNIDIKGIKVSSDVREQPIDKETLDGATNRIRNLKKYCVENNIQTDFYVAIEAGLVQLYKKYFVMQIAAISDNSEKISYGISSCYPVPEKYVNVIKEKSIGELFNEIYNKDDERHNKHGGIGELTHQKVTRIDLGEQAFMMALTEWINEEWK